jgi:hypothetical protein
MRSDVSECDRGAGGTHSRDNRDLRVPGHHGYSLADFAAERGYAVVTIDPLGTAKALSPQAISTSPTSPWRSPAPSPPCRR